ncbi:helix-turn-helix domain-containing protein [Prevotella ihumii]|uniref:helix-turn-helix domain-containing protein n=1 Tax=Prevotella ihumii TaxID=1917878 RepID=UPI00098127DA
MAEQLGKDQTTISKWYTNSSQPDLGNLMQIAKILDVELTDLVRCEEFKNETK